MSRVSSSCFFQHALCENIEHSHKTSKNAKCLRHKIVLYIQNFSENKRRNVFFSFDNDIFLLCSSLSSCKSLPGDSRRGGHRADLKGSVESRKSSSTRSSQEAEQVPLLCAHSRLSLVPGWVKTTSCVLSFIITNIHEEIMKKNYILKIRALLMKTIFVIFN